MLILSRKSKQQIHVGDDISITLVSVSGSRVKLGIDAPESVEIVRGASAQRGDYSGPPINYMTAEVNDPVAILARRIEAGKAELRYDETQGYLPAVLKALDVPVSSQTLVFSKTSMQRSRISRQCGDDGRHDDNRNR